MFTALFRLHLPTINITFIITIGDLNYRRMFTIFLFPFLTNIVILLYNFAREVWIWCTTIYAHKGVKDPRRL